MSVLDMTSIVALIGLGLVRLGIPILGLCLLCTGLKRAFPTQV